MTWKGSHRMQRINSNRSERIGSGLVVSGTIQNAEFSSPAGDVIQVRYIGGDTNVVSVKREESVKAPETEDLEAFLSSVFERSGVSATDDDLKEALSDLYQILKDDHADIDDIYLTCEFLDSISPSIVDSLREILNENSFASSENVTAVARVVRLLRSSRR